MILILAYGNDLRRDDGAGLWLAAELETRWRRAGADVQCLTAHQLTPELAADISQPDVAVVVFIDTRVGGCAPELKPLQSGSTSVIGHALNPAVLLAYAEKLFKRCPPAFLLTLPGTDFEHGFGFSSTTHAMLQAALLQAPQWLEHLQALAIRQTASN